MTAVYNEPYNQNRNTIEIRKKKQTRQACT